VPSIVVVINEVSALSGPVGGLQEGDRPSGEAMQRVQAREPEHKESSRTDSAIADEASVLPHEDEATDAPKHLHTVVAMIMERPQQLIERLLDTFKPNQPVAFKVEVLIVPDQHSQC
jgi:hypothetical protein